MVRVSGARIESRVVDLTLVPLGEKEGVCGGHPSPSASFLVVSPGLVPFRGATLAKARPRLRKRPDWSPCQSMPSIGFHLLGFCEKAPATSEARKTKVHQGLGYSWPFGTRILGFIPLAIQAPLCPFHGHYLSTPSLSVYCQRRCRASHLASSSRADGACEAPSSRAPPSGFGAHHFSWIAFVRRPCLPQAWFLRV